MDGFPNLDAAKATIAVTEGPDAVIAEFNARFMVTNEAGKAVIYAPNQDPVLHRSFYDRLTFADLRQLYMNRRVQVGRDDKGNAIMRPAAQVWLESPARRQFIRGIIFDPSGSPTPPETLNLWTGFATTPVPGDWSLMRSHIQQIICDSDPERFTYLMGWMARMVQRPAEQGEVAVVMKGGEGTGKGTLAKALMHIFGQHGLAISNSKHLTGNFNAHLRDAVFLFADEAFFAGDRAHVGALKSLITEPYLTIEGKYQNAMQSPNFLHLMMASNEEWVVPASLDARRFFVLEVSEAAKGQYPYFAAIREQMEAGGHAAMLHNLLAYDLTEFNVRHVPITEGLQRQQRFSLPIADLWWLDVLHRGYVWKSKLGLEADFGEWFEEASTELLYTAYLEFAERRRERHPLSRESLGRFMRKVGAAPKRLQLAIVGEHMADVPTGLGATTRRPEKITQARAPGYHLGSLEQSRAAFCEATGLTIEWSDSTEGDEDAVPCGNYRHARAAYEGGAPQPMEVEL